MCISLLGCFACAFTVSVLYLKRATTYGSLEVFMEFIPTEEGGICWYLGVLREKVETA